MNEPDVVLTDVGLALLGAYFAWRLWAQRGGGPLRIPGVLLMAGLASAAFWGAVFHAFFPDRTATPVGFVFWLPVVVSILLVAATLLDLALRLVIPRLGLHARRVVVALYAAGFLGFILFVDESFTAIVRFYAPALVLFLAASAWRALRTHSRAWTLIASGFAVSAGAAVLQQAGVSVHPTYFDHNALYHVVQAAALVLLFLGFRHTATMPGPMHGR